MGCASSKPSDNSTKSSKKLKDNDKKLSKKTKSQSSGSVGTPEKTTKQSDVNNASSSNNDSDESVKIDATLLEQIKANEDLVIAYIVKRVHKDLNTELLSSSNTNKTHSNGANFASVALAAAAAQDNEDLIIDVSSKAVNLIEHSNQLTYKSLNHSLKSWPFLCKNQANKSRICDLTCDTVRDCLTNLNNNSQVNLAEYLTSSPDFKYIKSEQSTNSIKSDSVSNPVLMSRTEANELARMLFLSNRGRPVVHSSSSIKDAYYVNKCLENNAEETVTKDEIDNILHNNNVLNGIKPPPFTVLETPKTPEANELKDEWTWTQLNGQLGDDVQVIEKQEVELKEDVILVTNDLETIVSDLNDSNVLSVSSTTTTTQPADTTPEQPLEEAVEIKSVLTSSPVEDSNLETSNDQSEIITNNLSEELEEEKSITKNETISENVSQQVEQSTDSVEINTTANVEVANTEPVQAQSEENNAVQPETVPVITTEPSVEVVEVPKVEPVEVVESVSEQLVKQVEEAPSQIDTDETAKSVELTQQEVQPEVQPEVQTEIQSEVQPEVQTEAQPEAQTEPQDEAQVVETQSESIITTLNIKGADEITVTETNELVESINSTQNTELKNDELIITNGEDSKSDDFKTTSEFDNTNNSLNETNSNTTTTESGNLDPVLEQSLLDDRFYNNDSFKNGPPVNGEQLNEAANKIQASLRGDAVRGELKDEIQDFSSNPLEILTAETSTLVETVDSTKSFALIPSSNLLTSVSINNEIANLIIKQKLEFEVEEQQKQKQQQENQELLIERQIEQIFNSMDLNPADNNNNKSSSSIKSTEELDKAAIKIQSTFRGYKTRKNLNKQQLIDQQKQLKKLKKRSNSESDNSKTVSSAKRTHLINDPQIAAIKIQSTFRGYKTRKLLLLKNKTSKDSESSEQAAIVINNLDLAYPLGDKPTTKNTASSQSEQDDIRKSDSNSGQL